MISMNAGNLKFRAVISSKLTHSKPGAQMPDAASELCRQPTPLQVYQPDRQVLSSQQQKFLEIKKFEQYMCKNEEKYNQFSLSQPQRDQFTKLLEE